MTDREAGVLVEALWSAVSRGGKSLEQIPQMIKTLLETQGWRKRIIRTGKIVEHDTFHSFLVTPPLKGCGYDPEKIRKLISDDPETLVLWREAMKLKMGRPSKKVNDNVTDLSSKTGNSLTYTLSRLHNQRRDLFEQVKAGSLSANSAAIKAGFRKVRTPLQILNSAWLKASPQEREQFLSGINQSACP